MRRSGVELAPPVLGLGAGLPSPTVLGTRGQQVPRAALGPVVGGEDIQWVPLGLAGLTASPWVPQSPLSPPALRNGSSGLSSGRWVCSTQAFAPRKLLQMSEPKFLLFNFLLLILSLLVLRTSFPNSFLLSVFHLL